MAAKTSRTSRSSARTYSRASASSAPSKRKSSKNSAASALRNHIANMSAQWHEPNYTLIGLLALLLLFGLIMLSSASSVAAFENFGDPNYYVKRQLLIGFGIGLPAMWALSRIDYHLWKKHAILIMVGSVVLLFLVLVPGIGVELLGARRWISLGGLVFQPSEVAKLAFLIYLGVWLEAKQKHIHDYENGFIPFVMMIAFLVFMIAGIQKDLGTMVVIGVIAISGYFVAGAPWKHIATIVGSGLAGIFFLIKILPIFIPSFSYRANRLTVFLNPDVDPQGIGYHINQALLAIGSGGIFGLGLGHSRQKFNYLPEAASDSIFAVIAEEMGFIIAGGLVLIFLAFMVQGYTIAKQAPDIYGKVIATGITTWIMFQAIVNIMAMLSLLPLTGIPLPFISYGSTSLVTLLAAVGILINVSRQTR